MMQLELLGRTILGIFLATAYLAEKRFTTRIRCLPYILIERML